MRFTSGAFILFFAVLVAVYYLVPKKLQWRVLLVASYMFYASAGWWALCYLVGSTLTTWLSARGMGGAYAGRDGWLADHPQAPSEEKKVRKAKTGRVALRWAVFGILINLTMLGVVKYTDFILTGVNGALSSLGKGAVPLPRFLLPMGISFYIFQSTGYLIDIYRETYPPEKSLGKTALFVSFFPQMVQGPISRFDQLAPSLFGEHKWDAQTVGFGLQRILWGFFKKLVVADRLMVAVNTLSGSPDQYQGAYVLALMVVYAVTLYADFTGGIDITIGAAQVLGVRLAENFQRPFFSKNTAEYWRRWHITMGTWFRDYIFYPVTVSGGMRKLTRWWKKKGHPKVARRMSVYLATMLTWFVTGAWHGASWNFIVWGLLNGVVVLVSQELEPLYARFHARFPELGKTWGYRLFQVGRTFLLMSAIRVLDCYRNVPVTFAAVGTLFTRFDPRVLWNGRMLALGVSGAGWAVAGVGTAMMLAVSLLSRRQSLRQRLTAWPLGLRWALFGGLLVVTVVFGAYGVGYNASQFIYNQF